MNNWTCEECGNSNKYYRYTCRHCSWRRDLPIKPCPLCGEDDVLVACDECGAECCDSCWSANACCKEERDAS